MQNSGRQNSRGGQICKNVTVTGRRTSLRMEPVMWEALRQICEIEGRSLGDICTQIDARRGEANLTASIRVFIISYFRDLARRSPVLEAARQTARERVRASRNPPPPPGIDGLGTPPQTPYRAQNLVDLALNVVGPDAAPQGR